MPLYRIANVFFISVLSILSSKFSNWINQDDSGVDDQGQLFATFVHV